MDPIAMPGNRTSIHLLDYDYRWGTFFISLVAEGRTPLFGQVVNDNVILSEAGQIIKAEWLRTPLIRKEARLDEWVVMPDHFQAIVSMNGINLHVGGACRRPCPSGTNSDPNSNPDGIQNIQPMPRSLARLINQFKSVTTHKINTLYGVKNRRIWQRGYHERIIRGENELAHVRQYIRDNPKNYLR